MKGKGRVDASPQEGMKEAKHRVGRVALRSSRRKLEAWGTIVRGQTRGLSVCRAQFSEILTRLHQSQSGGGTTSKKQSCTLADISYPSHQQRANSFLPCKRCSVGQVSSEGWNVEALRKATHTQLSVTAVSLIVVCASSPIAE